MAISSKPATLKISKPAIFQGRKERSGLAMKWMLLVILACGVLFFLFLASLIGIVFLQLFSEEQTKSGVEQWEVAQGFPQAAAKYLSIYQAAGKKYGVPWHILAAIHKVETNFGHDLSVSSVGAKGHTQVRP